MNKLILSSLIFFSVMICSMSAFAQTAQPQNSRQNATPVQSGTDGNNQNPSSISPSNNPFSPNVPGDNTTPGNKPANGNQGASNPYNNELPRNIGQTGGTGPNRNVPNPNNGSDPQQSPPQH